MVMALKEPILNWKLVRMNQNYTRLVNTVTSEYFPQDLGELRSVFTDWGQMVLNEESISDLRERVTSDYEQIFSQTNYELPDGVA